MISLLKRLAHRILKNLNRKIVPMDTFGSHSVDDALGMLAPVNGTLTVLDVGANVGFFSQGVLQAATNTIVHAFEPFPEAYDRLQDLAKRFEERLFPHMNAMSDKPGASLLFLNSADVTNSLLPNADSAADYQPAHYSDPVGTLEVALNTVDAFCKKESISTIHLLKIDTQGTDLNVLKGARELIENSEVCLILVEVLFVPMYSDQCWFHEIQTWLTARGFQLVQLYEINRDDSLRFSKWADALFVSRNAMEKALSSKSNQGDQGLDS